MASNDDELALEAETELNFEEGGDIEGDEEEEQPAAGAASEAADDPELEQIRAKVKDLQDETAKLLELQAEQSEQLELPSASSAASGKPSGESREEIDARSVHVGNVDYHSKPEELQAHFTACGTINRVTILCDKFSGRPKGYAYVEFVDPESVDLAMALDGSNFRGRELKVDRKRTNLPGMSRGRRGRGRGGRGYRGGFRPYRPRGRYRNKSATFAPY